MHTFSLSLFQIEGLVEDMEGRLQSCDDAIMKAPSLEINDLIENAKTLTKQAKTLTSSRVCLNIIMIRTLYYILLL